MAETTPSALAISTIDAGADHPAKPPVKTRPDKPDEAAYKDDLSKAEKAVAAAQETFAAIKSKIDTALPRNSESPAGKRQQELKKELAAIRQQQSGFKNQRGSVQEKIASLDAQVKSRINEQKLKRAQVPFKSVDEIEREIQRQEKIVESPTATIVDQKKAIAEQSNLRKQKKLFATFEEFQKGIDGVKAQIAELKKSIDNPEAKALSQRYDALDQEFKSIKAEQDDAYKNIHKLRDEQNKAYADRQEKQKALREVKDKYYKAKTAFREYEQEQYRIRREREKQERDAFHKEKRKQIAQQKLDEASQPAYADVIQTAEMLIRHFDPSAPETSKPLRGPSGFAAEARRTVDQGSGFEGMKVVKKDDDDNYFVGSTGKKGKKGKRGQANSPAPGTPSESNKFNLNSGLITSLAEVSVEPPMSQNDVPTVLTKLREKRDAWKSQQDAKTKENIEAAKKEIEKLENEAKESNHSHKSRDIAKKPSVANQAVEGKVDAEAELVQEQDGADDAAKDLKEASIEDKATA